MACTYYRFEQDAAAQPYRVEYRDRLTPSLRDEISEWMETDEVDGLWDYAHSGRGRYIIKFSDERTALLFKLRFG